MIPLIDKKKTGVHLRRIMDSLGITVKDVQQYLNLGSVQSIYHWLNGQSMPTIDNLYALSELFQIPIDAMVCGNRKPIQAEYILKNQTTQLRRMHVYSKEWEKKSAA